MSFHSRLRSKYFIVIADRASRYLQMFKGKEEMARPEIDWAIKVLSREDRVIWYLRHIKTHPVNDSLKEKLNHFVGMAKTVKSIEDYKFNPNDTDQKILNDLSLLEQRSKEQYEETSHLVPQEGVKILDLGGKWSWWDLQKGYSVDEANAMGHCGNANHQHGDTILSLREEKKVGSQVAYEPHCTFILNEGTLGEMKGRGNEKPAKKYHKAIVALLESPIVKHVIGGGYQNKAKGHVNFTLDDLTDAERDHLLKIKPHLDPMRLTTLSELEKVRVPSKHYSEFKDKLDEVSLGVEFGLNTKAPDPKGNLKKMEEYFYIKEPLKNYSDNANFKLVHALAYYSDNNDILKKIALFEPENEIILPHRKRGAGSPALIATSRIKDQKTLMEIAKSSQKEAIVEKALDSLDEKNIEKLVEENPALRPRAIQYVHNEALLKKLYDEDDNIDVKNHAVNNIDDQKFLEKVANEKFDPRSGNFTPDQVAITKLKDSKLLVELANSDIPSKRVYAYWSLPDKELIAICNKEPKRIKEVLAHAKAAKSTKFMSRCLKELDDVEARKSVVENAKTKGITSIILEAITNADLPTPLREYAVNRLDDNAIENNSDALVKSLRDAKDKTLILSFIRQFNQFLTFAEYLLMEIGWNTHMKKLSTSSIRDALQELATKSPDPEIRVAAHHKASNRKEIVKQLVLDDELTEEQRKDIVNSNREWFELSFDEFKKLPLNVQREYILRIGGPTDDTYTTGAGRTIPFLDKIENPELFDAVIHTVSNLFARQKSKISSSKRQLTKLFNSSSRRELVTKIGKSLPNLIDGGVFTKLAWFQDLYLKALNDPLTEHSVKDAIKTLLYGYPDDAGVYDKEFPTKYMKTETGKLFLSKIKVAS